MQPWSQSWVAEQGSGDRQSEPAGADCELFDMDNDYYHYYHDYYHDHYHYYHYYYDTLLDNIIIIINVIMMMIMMLTTSIYDQWVSISPPIPSNERHSLEICLCAFDLPSFS